MAEQNPESTKKLGKRGGYSSEHKLNFTRTADGKNWEIKVKHEEKSDIDKERSKLNSRKNKDRDVLVDEILQAKAAPDRKEATRIANYAIEGEYKKPKKGQKPPIRYNFKQRDKLKDAQEAYRERRPLDKKSEEARRGSDNSDRKIYDLIRNSRKERKKEIYLYGEDSLPLKNIYQVTNTGKRISADKIPLLDTTVTKYDKDGKPLKDKNGNIVKEHIKGRDGKSIVSYEVSSDKIIAIGNTASISASNVRRPHLAVTVTKVKRRKSGNKIIFTRENGLLVTATHIDLLFRKTEEARGANAPIYLNNIPFQQADFYKVKGGWALTPSATAELNAPEYDGTISVRYSQIYRRELVSLQTKTELGKATKAEKQNFGEITTTLALGSTLENITIICRSKDAYDAIRKMVAINKKSNAEIYCVVSRDFTATKQNGKAIIELGATEREGNNTVIDKNVVMDSQGNIIGKYGVYDRYLVISWRDGYFVIQAKFLDVIYGGLLSDKGEEEEKFDSP